MITLTLKEPPPVPLEAEALSPDRLLGLREAEIRALPAFLGKRQVRLDDFFTVEGEASEHLRIRGDCGRVKWIGREMTRGRIDVEGNAGMHLGAYMKGGEIHVSGNASDWVGAEMSGGLIHVRGHAGGQLGAAYRGSPTGMRDGTILVEGTAGLEIGMRMKRGLIAVRGKVRDFAGLQMKGGTIVLLSGAEVRTGAWMARGTIVSLAPLRLLPTFAYACAYRPAFLRLLAGQLRRHGFDLPAEAHGSYRRFCGDSATPGKGEILCWQSEAAAA
jgi:formylmethanofuran dehydrogenase subunit C